MSLRQFLTSRRLVRSLNGFSEVVQEKWNDFAVRFGLHEDVFSNPRHMKLKAPVTVILIGAGHRGNIYANYALEYPDEMQIVAVAELNQTRLKSFQKKHRLKTENCYTYWNEIFSKEKFADAVIIANGTLFGSS